MKSLWTIYILLAQTDSVMEAECDALDSYTCLFQLKVGGTYESSGAEGTRVLIALRTRYQNLHTRLRTTRDTWMQGVGKQDEVIVFVADPGLKTTHSGTAPTLPGVQVTPIDCPDSHNVGLNCEMSEVFRLVLPMVVDKYDAFFVVDDDAYLDVPNLKTTVEGVKGPVAFGVWGCTEPPYVGFCGGGGYGLTKEAARQLLHSPEALFQSTQAGGGASTKSVLNTTPWTGEQGKADDFVTRYLNASQAIYDLPKHMAWEDVAFGVTVKSIGLVTETLPGLYGWKLDPTQYDKAVRSCHPLPINFHYVTEEKKRKLHADLAKFGCSAATARATAGSAVALAQEAWYISARDTALLDGSVRPGAWA